MRRSKIIVLGVLVLILSGITGFLIYKNPKIENWINITQAPTEKCRSCTDVWDESCPGNSSCVVPAGASSGVCLPVPKMGQSYRTNSQINQYCGTSFSENVAEINSEEEAIIRTKIVYPEVKNIKKGPSGLNKSDNVSSRKTDLGWKLLFWQGAGDCPAGCLSNHYWYFMVSKNGKVDKIGEYERVFNARKNGFDEAGSPMWDFLDKD